MNRIEHRRRGGFTRRELLVVIAALGIVLAVLLPSHSVLRERGQMEEYLDQGRQIYTTLYMIGDSVSDAISDRHHDVWQAVYPQSKPPEREQRFASSSAYFSYIVESNWMVIGYSAHDELRPDAISPYSKRSFNYIVDSRGTNAGYGYFAPAGSGLIPASNRTEFLDGTLRNIWCRTLDINDGTKAGTPELFTQNFKFLSRHSDATLKQMVGLETNARPFGKEGGIVIRRSGAGAILDAETATQTNFNPTGATNSFLWPLASGQDVSGR